MGAGGFLGTAMATVGLAAAAIAAVPTILDQAQGWSGAVAGAGFTLAFLGLLVGTLSKR